MLVELDLGRGAPAVRQLIGARGRYHAILHFAAHSLVGESMREPFRYLRDKHAETALNLIRGGGSSTASPNSCCPRPANPVRRAGAPARSTIGSAGRIAPRQPVRRGRSNLIERLPALGPTQAKGLRSACLRYFQRRPAPILRACSAEDHEPGDPT